MPIEWEAPPNASRGRGRSEDVDSFVEALKGRPGEWAIYRRGVKPGYSSSALSKRGCQTAYRKMPVDGSSEMEGVLYVRYPSEPVTPIKRTRKPKEAAPAETVA